MTARRKEKIAIWIAWRLPRRLIYWCFIRVCSYANSGKYDHEILPDISLGDAGRRWVSRDAESNN